MDYIVVVLVVAGMVISIMYILSNYGMLTCVFEQDCHTSNSPDGCGQESRWLIESPHVRI